MAKNEAPYRCDECGWTAFKWVGRCGECQAWGTVIEVAAPTTRSRQVKPVIPLGEHVAKPITDYSGEESGHRPTGIGEFDRVLGGGIVPGAVILLSGEPGVGKSTLLLDVAAKVATQGKSVLYVSAEESAGQVHLRATRTGGLHERLLVANDTDLGLVLGHIEYQKPHLVIIDSVQTLSSGLIDGSAGGVAQVREVAATLIRVAKDTTIPIILVGHVTKDGQVAGPRTLEHLVDVVCQFEGDRQTALRFVRALKNRFGPTDEVGCFEMSGDGILEVPDPSGLFRSASGNPVSGTCTTVALEGRRALPVEVQALVVPSGAPQPRRVVNGVESSRVAMLLAVLERRAGIPLSSADVYVSTVGGIRLHEPGADLAIALAVASAAKDIPLSNTTVAIGEISLAGEIRPVSQSAQRINEAQRLGFNTVLDQSHTTISNAIADAFAKSPQRQKQPDF